MSCWGDTSDFVVILLLLGRRPSPPFELAPMTLLAPMTSLALSTHKRSDLDVLNLHSTHGSSRFFLGGVTHGHEMYLILCFFFSASRNKSSPYASLDVRGAETGDRRCFGVVTLAIIPLGWGGACHWFLADKNNPLIIFNSGRPFGEETLGAFFPVAKGLQRPGAKTALFHWFFFSFFFLFPQERLKV